MSNRRQRETPIKNVGGSQITAREAQRRDDRPAQQEARRRASEPGIELGPDSELLADEDPARRVSANQRGGGGASTVRDGKR